MRKLIGLFLGLMLIALPKAEASVSNMSAQLGIYNSTDNAYGLEVDNNNDFYFATTSGSIVYPTSSATTTTTLTINNSGQVVIFTGTSSNTRFTLPSCVTIGQDMDIVANVAKYMTVTPAGSDQIMFSTLTAGQSIQNSSTAAIGDEIELFCGVAGKWSIKNKTGTWAVGS